MSPPRLRYILPLAVGFLFLHAISLVVFRSHATAATYPFIIVAAFLALFASCHRARIPNSNARLPWILFIMGLLLWLAAIFLSAREELVQHASSETAILSDFFYFMYAAPVLLAISSPAEEQRIALFVWLDGLQVIVTAYLAYITLFAVAPFTATPVHPVSASLVTLVNNLENLILACAATLRVLARPRQGEQRRFFLILCGFLWAFAVCFGIYNYFSSVTDDHGMLDIVGDIPFLFLAVAAWLPVAQHVERPRIAARKPLTLFIENASPIFYTLALVALGSLCAGLHFAAL